MKNETTDLYALDRKYYNTIQNYTLALLSAFDNLWFYTQNIQNSKYVNDSAHKVPINFGNYEKSIILQDIQEDEISKGNFNIIPRMVLIFDSLSKAAERQTQKYQRITKRIALPDSPNAHLEMAYNSIAYDFHYRLLLQARGMTMASQLVEQILGYFNPTMNLNIQEFPLWTEMTQTQIMIEDPEFEILDEFEDVQVNIINVTFNITIRGNIYSNIGYQGAIEVVNLFTHVWDEFELGQSKLSKYYKFDVNDDGVINKETLRTYIGTEPYNSDVLLPLEQMQDKRDDFNPPETVNIINNK